MISHLKRTNPKSNPSPVITVHQRSDKSLPGPSMSLLFQPTYLMLCSWCCVGWRKDNWWSAPSGLAVRAAQMEREPQPGEPYALGELVHHQEVPGVAAGRERSGLRGRVQTAAQWPAAQRASHRRPGGANTGQLLSARSQLPAGFISHIIGVVDAEWCWTSERTKLLNCVLHKCFTQVFQHIREIFKCVYLMSPPALLS